MKWVWVQSTFPTAKEQEITKIRSPSPKKKTRVHFNLGCLYKKSQSALIFLKISSLQLKVKYLSIWMQTFLIKFPNEMSETNLKLQFNKTEKCIKEKYIFKAISLYLKQNKELNYVSCVLKKQQLFSGLLNLFLKLILAKVSFILGGTGVCVCVHLHVSHTHKHT